MVANFPGEYAIEVNYTGVTSDHKALYSLQIDGVPDVGDTWSSINVLQRSGVVSTLDSYVSGFLTKFVALMNTSQSVGLVELYRYTVGTYDRQFISSKNYALAGTNAASSVALQQMTYTFRSTNGGIARIQVMEGTSSRQNCVTYDDMTSFEKALVDEFSKPATAFIARDNGFPFAFIRACGGQNEKLWRLANR